MVSFRIILKLCMVSLLIYTNSCADLETTENIVRLYVNSIDVNRTIIKNQAALASWQYESDITDEHNRINEIMELKSADFDKAIANQLKTFQWQNFHDEDLKRKIKKLTDLGDSILPPGYFNFNML